MTTEQELIGKTLEEAEKICNNIRPLIIDGRSLMGTMDFNPFRLNVEIQNGLIVRVINKG